MNVVDVTGTPAFGSILLTGFNAPGSSLELWPATGGFAASVFDAGGTAKSIASNIKLEDVLPDTATSGSLTPDPTRNQVGQTGANITLKFNPKHTVPSNGQFIFYVPRQAVSNDHNVQSPICNTVSANLNSALSCTYSTTTQNVVVTSISTGADITTEVEFTVSGIINPITTSPTSGYIIYSADSDGGTIDKIDLTFTVTQPYNIAGASLSQIDTREVGELSGITLSLGLPFPVDSSTCRLEYIFPADYPVIPAFVTGYTGSGIITTGTGFVTLNATHVEIDCNSGSNVDAGTPIQISLNKLKNPGLIKTTSPIQINLKTNSGSQIAQSTTDVFLDAANMLPGQIDSITVTPDSNLVQALSQNYLVQFRPKHNLPNSGGQTPKVRV